MQKFRFLKALCVLALALLSSPARAQSLTAGWEPQKTYAFFVGVLKWEDTELDSFSNVHRKDKELYDTLIARGVPKAHTRYLVDQQATLAQIRTQMAQLAASAPADATFIFYYAGHGLREETRETFLANFDIDSSEPESNGFGVSEVGKILAANFKGKNILIWADNCYSGALAAVAKGLGTRGYKAVSLTSSQSANTSTGNWTFTQTLIDSLRGEPLADANGNGQITLSEVAAAEGLAMKYREWQMNSYTNTGLPEDWIMAKAIGANPALGARTAGGIPIGSYVQVNQDGEWEAARVLAQEGDAYLVQLYDYSDYKNLRVPRKQLRNFSYTHYAPGTKVSAFCDDKYYDAKVLELKDDFHHITYPEWDSTWDEWVLSDRLRPAKTSNAAND